MFEMGIWGYCTDDMFHFIVLTGLKLLCAYVLYRSLAKINLHKKVQIVNVE